MKKAIAAALLTCGVCAATSPAWANEHPNPSGPYVGIGWGQFNLDIDNIEEVADSINDITKADDNAWKVFAGYRVNPYLAFEGAYIDFGRPGDRFDTSGSDGNYRVEISGFAPYVIGTIPLGPVELFGKVGYYYYDVDVRIDLDDPGPNIDSKHSESDFLYGGGIGVMLGEHLNLRVEYEAVDIERAENSDAMWLSTAWRF